ncbi:hypothetical protein D3C87_1973760 [compost metagenome]
MAVEDNDKPAPSNSAGRVEMPSTISNPPSSIAVPSTCRLPRPNTTRRNASIFVRENSSPRENSRKTTPSSARSGKSSPSLTQLNADGPIISPTHR